MPERPRQPARAEPTPAVELQGVSFAYPGSAGPAVQNVSLRVMPGERLGVLGPNGGGKTTLLRLILGLERPQQGRVLVAGLAPGEARKRGLVGYVPQRTEAELGFPMSVRELVTLGASWRRWPWQRLGSAERQRVERAIELVGAGAFADRPIGALSGGQLQRAMVARALAGLAMTTAGALGGLLVLDEPTVGIDAVGQQQFAELLHDVHRSGLGAVDAAAEGSGGLTILIVSHDIRAVAAGSDRVACLSRTLHYHDSPSGLTPRVLAEVFSHDVAGLAGIHVHAHGPGEPCPHEPEPGGGQGGASAVEHRDGLVQLDVLGRNAGAVSGEKPGQRPSPGVSP